MSWEGEGGAERRLTELYAEEGGKKEEKSLTEKEKGKAERILAEEGGGKADSINRITDERKGKAKKSLIDEDVEGPEGGS